MKKVFMVLIVFLSLLFLFNVDVYALEDTFYEGEYISGEYIKKFKDDTGKYQQLRVFRRNSDDQFVYCIELWEALQSNRTITGYSSNQNTYADININTWKQIVLISYYGYGYQNHTDIKWYVITQFMIWQVTSPDSNIYFTDTLNGNKITKYEEEINEINNLILEHDKRPSFNNQKFQINYNEEYKITDTDDVLSKFSIYAKNGLTVKKNGNDLIVTSKMIGNPLLTLVKKDTKYSNNPIVYVDNNGQDVLAPGKYDPVYSVVTFKLPKATLEINNLDIETNNVSQGDAKLLGSKFQLLDLHNNVIFEKEVNSDGIVKFDKIGYGNYYLKEIKSSEGYLLNNNSLSININKELVKVDFYSQVIKNKVVINKYLKNYLSNEEILEDGAVFSVYNSKNEKVMTFSTSEGKYEFELPYGKYQIYQDSGTKNYSLVENFEINVVDNDKVQTFDLYSNELVSNIKIINTDDDSNLPILEAGATFMIKDLETNEYLKDKLNNELTFTTNNLGEINFITLSSGKYEIEQLTSVSGYDISDNVIFEISDYTLFSENNDDYLEINVQNKKQKAKLELEKIIEYYFNDALIKIEKSILNQVSIYANSDIYSKDGLKLYNKDDEVELVNLDENDTLSTLLVLGNYYIKNPIDNTIIEITLNNTNSKTIQLKEQIFDYEVIIDNEDNLVIEVPNTLDMKISFFNMYLLFILFGLLFIAKGKKNENS